MTFGGVVVSVFVTLRRDKPARYNVVVPTTAKQTPKVNLGAKYFWIPAPVRDKFRRNDHLSLPPSDGHGGQVAQDRF